MCEFGVNADTLFFSPVLVVTKRQNLGVHRGQIWSVQLLIAIHQLIDVDRLMAIFLCRFADDVVIDFPGRIELIAGDIPALHNFSGGLIARFGVNF